MYCTALLGPPSTLPPAHMDMLYFLEIYCIHNTTSKISAKRLAMTNSSREDWNRHSPLRIAAAVAAVVTAAPTDATFLFIEHFTVDKLDTTGDEGAVQAGS